MQQKRIFFVGLGDVGGAIFDFFVRIPGQHHFLVGGRDLDYLQQRTNLSLFAAMQLGFFPKIELVSVDLENVDQMAEILTRFKPDIIFFSATLQRWGAINALPKSLSERLYQAQIGPWLPLQLVLIYKLMLAVQKTGLTVNVINATYPDVTHTILSKVGLTPMTGIGDLANNIPALKKSVALKLNKPVESVIVYFVAQHHVSYWMSRKGHSGGAPFYFVAYVDGDDVTPQLDITTLCDLLPGVLKRASGNLMTAASATTIFDSIVHNTGKIIHAPGPQGLPGGYPVRFDAEGVHVVLPTGITLEEACSINTTAQQFDGIERVDDDGTVYFVEHNMAILKDVLGYECKKMPLSEVEAWAGELRAKYLRLLAQT